MNESFFRFVHLCLLIISLTRNKVSFRSLHLNWLLLMCWNSNPAYWNWRLLSSTCYIVQDAACLNHKRKRKEGKMRKEKWKEDIVLSFTFPLSVLFLYSAIIQATEQYSAVVLFTTCIMFKMALTCQFINEVIKCNRSKVTYCAILFWISNFFLLCDHSNETSFKVLLDDMILFGFQCFKMWFDTICLYC